MSKKFSIILNGVDTLPNCSSIVDTIKNGIKGLFKEAGREFEIKISRGIERKSGDLTLKFDKSLRHQGPGIVSFLGDASGRGGTIYVDEHRRMRLGGGIRPQFTYNNDRKILGTDYISRIKSLYEFDDPALAKFIGTTAVHEIGHMLGHKGSLNPADIMYDITKVPKARGTTVKSAKRFWSNTRPFLTNRQTMINAIKTGNVGTGDFKVQTQRSINKSTLFSRTNYAVKKGDTLWKLAPKFGYQDKRRFVNAFKRLNPNVRDPNMIYHGRRYNMPFQGSSSLKPSPTNLIRPTGIQPSSSLVSTNYRVNSGENLWKRAPQFGYQDKRRFVQDFKRLNPNVKDPNMIYRGRKYKMPFQGVNPLRSYWKN